MKNLDFRTPILSAKTSTVYLLHSRNRFVEGREFDFPLADFKMIGFKVLKLNFQYVHPNYHYHLLKWYVSIQCNDFNTRISLQYLVYRFNIWIRDGRNILLLKDYCKGIKTLSHDKHMHSKYILDQLHNRTSTLWSPVSTLIRW